MDHRPTRQRRTNRPASVTSEPAGQPESEIAVPEFPTGTLWHYTTPAGLLGILGNVDDKPEDGKPRSGTYKPILHASAAQFLNDKRELILGLELIKDGLVELGIGGSFDHTPEAKAFLQEIARSIQLIIDQKYPHIIDCSTISFSAEPNLLSQWRAYGQGTGGFAIGFDPKTFPRDSTPERIGGWGSKGSPTCATPSRADYSTPFICSLRRPRPTYAPVSPPRLRLTPAFNASHFVQPASNTRASLRKTSGGS